MTSSTDNSSAVSASADAATIESVAPQQAAATSSAGYPPLSQAYWALFVFALSLVVNFLDRGIINLLVEPIKRDLHLTDVQVSLLMGFAFIVFYIVLGFPIASLVDSRSRRAIVGFGLFCWSGMTALCGVAQNFWSFFFCRVGVGVGEACTGPATFSMLADFFPPAKLTRAIALMSFGAIAGVGLAQMIGAGVIQSLQGVPDLHVPVLGVIHNWQMVFFVVGLPGLVVAALMFTVVEPPRRGRMRPKTTEGSISWIAVLKFVAANWKCYGPILFAVGLSTIVFSGSAAWSVVFYQRTYHWTPVQSGYLLGVMVLFTAPTGLMLGSWFTERYAARGFDDANLRVASWAVLFAIPWSIIAPLMPTPWLALLMTGINGVLVSIAGSPISAALQVVTPNEMRGRVSALYLFIINVLGTGLGPTVIATLTDVVFHDEAKLRYSLALSAGLVTWVPAACYWYARRHYRAAFIRAKGWQ
ncbi:MAG TPA: MFS transporter [Alphaproteobacteria bacterium]|nr:MFS transporter [Alphaproteobacteria bacterium]